MGTAATHHFPVRLQKTKAELTTISDILEKGTKKDILEFVSTKNILNPQIFNFFDIYYLLKDKEFYLEIMAILRTRGIYDQNCWAFAYYHNDLDGIREHLASRQAREFMRPHILFFKNSIA